MHIIYLLSQVKRWLLGYIHALLGKRAGKKRKNHKAAAAAARRLLAIIYAMLMNNRNYTPQRKCKASWGGTALLIGLCCKASLLNDWYCAFNTTAIMRLRSRIDECRNCLYTWVEEKSLKTTRFNIDEYSKILSVLSILFYLYLR